MTDPEFAAAIAAAFQAFNERRFADFATYVTEDVVETYPQSGERIEGRDIQLAFHQAFSNPPTFTVRNVLRSGDLAVPLLRRQPRHPASLPAR
jgi:ketosteroid isomerase-like protein